MNSQYSTSDKRHNQFLVTLARLDIVLHLDVYLELAR